MDTKGAEMIRSRLPRLGLGTWQVKPSEIPSVVEAALSAGYRYIDTAQVYGNEAAIGDALALLLPKYNLKREDIFITSKLAPANQGAAKARQSVEESLSKLKTEYLDLFIIHWPGSSNKSDSPENSKLRKESWEALETLYKEGKLHAIGVSNYNIVHLNELLGHATVLPALNQVEYHPFYHQDDLVALCKEKGIHFQAYSSLGGPDAWKELFENPTVKAIAKKYDWSPAKVLLAWALSQDISVLPRSTKPERVRENLDALNARLTVEEVDALRQLGVTKKTCWDPASVL